MSLPSGARLGPYEIVAPLGAGGMGEVYRARDTRLGRDVAIKVLPSDVATDPDRRRRFEQEARTVSSLSHPGIVTLFEIESAEGPSGAIEFLAMELVPGRALKELIPAGGMPVATAVDLALQAAEALAAAHEAGVVHRDLKPANLMVTPAGRLKLLDFGLARLLPTALSGADAPTLADGSLTRAGAILGTLGYLSPEQAAGERADPRSDLFSFGVVLYEMLAGVSPFARDSPIRSLTAVLHEPAAPVGELRAELPAALGALVARCLEKEPSRRPGSAREIATSLRAIQEAASPTAPSRGGARGVGLGAAAATLALAAAAGIVWWRGADERWLRREAIPRIEALVVEDRHFEAFAAAREAERRAPGESLPEALLERFTLSAKIASEPLGAAVSIRDYRTPNGAWLPLGTTPIERVRISDAPTLLRVELPGFTTIESAPPPDFDSEGRLDYRFELSRLEETPPGMVRVGGGQSGYRLDQSLPVESFWIDRLEVSNRDFQRFVDDDGYRRRELWRQPLLDGERELGWQEAMDRFRDATGRPGPATWELGHYAEGAGDLPVGGVSWYEAVAYAEWAGKSLPTYYHWFRAASPDLFSDILDSSNFAGVGPTPVGSLAGVGPWGTLDMAGNVKEWAWNGSGAARYLLGGGWNEASYLYAEPDRAPPFAREPTHGFRCALLTSPAPAALTASVARFERDLSRERPVDESVFAALASAYSYDRAAPLAPAEDPAREETEVWRLERVSIATAYRNERLPIRLYLPKGSRPPYASVIYFPDSSAEQFGVSERLQLRYFEFLVRSGRAVVFPVFDNTYERRVSGWSALDPNRRRDLTIAWSKDLGRTLDYLATRSDFDSRRIALYGLSLGAVTVPILAALEPRLATAVSLGGGLPARRVLPDADPLNFAPRVHIPVLYVAGREDFVRPLEISQRPLFDLLGTTSDKKRLAVLDGGHIPARMNEIVREILDWLDRWLGPVTRR